mmetsp:Transcript_93598/g.195127  ORF Transcript_93598/g.195127 Transcript_93598/m.195127 type:complete len:368 (-) Transcript_93598:19-1122(-)
MLANYSLPFGAEGSDLHHRLLHERTAESFSHRPDRDGAGAIVIRSLIYAGVPALAMAFGSVSVCFFSPPRKLQATAQRFSSGLLMGVTIINIFPLLQSRLRPFGSLDRNNVIALYVGFIGAVILMYGLDNLGEESIEGGECFEEGNEARDPEDGVASDPGTSTEEPSETEEDGHGLTPVPGRSFATTTTGTSRLREWKSKAKHLDEISVKEGSEGSSNRPVHVPWGLIIAVIIDCCVDGMLIGLTTTGPGSSGLMLAIAASIESGFLGFSFTLVLLRTIRRRWSALIALLPCISMVVASYVAGKCSQGLETTPAFAGVLAFCLIALLFMIVEELLVEARDNEFGDLWTIGVWFYIGLLLSITFDIVI